jgi:hypothetical protein
LFVFNVFCFFSGGGGGGVGGGANVIFLIDLGAAECEGGRAREADED